LEAGSEKGGPVSIGIADRDKQVMGVESEGWNNYRAGASPGVDSMGSDSETVYKVHPEQLSEIRLGVGRIATDDDMNSLGCCAGRGRQLHMSFKSSQYLCKHLRKCI
jgi:hypothetical protein